jgi:hypothetical protein
MKKQNANRTREDSSNAVLLIRKPEACRRYGISLRFLNELIAEGSVPVRKLGRRCARIPVAEADEFFLGKEATR